MLKNLFVLIFLNLSGCIIIIPDNGSLSRSEWGPAYGEVVIESPYISCTYDAYWDLSEWVFEVYTVSHFGPEEILEVGFYINNHDYQYMNYLGDGWWSRTFLDNYYDCDRDYHFDFIATDYDGFEGYYSLYW